MDTEHIQKMLDRCPNEESLNTIIHVSWSRAGIGFGEFYIWQDENGLYIEDERMGKEFVRNVINKIIDDAEIKS